MLARNSSNRTARLSVSSSGLIRVGPVGGHNFSPSAPAVILAPDDRTIRDAQRPQKPIVRRTRINDRMSIDHLLDDVLAGLVAEPAEGIIAAIELGIHVGHGVNAVRAIAVARRFADGVDALITDSAALEEFLLDQG